MKQEKIKNKLRLPLWLTIILWGGWAYLVLSHYYKIYPVDIYRQLSYIFSTADTSESSNFGLVLVNNLFYIFLLAVLIFSAYCVGRIFIRLLKLKEENFLGDFILSVAIGLGLEAYLIFMLGLTKLLYQPLINTFVSALALGGIYFFIKNCRDRTMCRPYSFKDIHLPFSLKIFLSAIFISTASMNLLGALTPETFYDSLVYHLAVPQYYLYHHQVKEISYNFFSNYPQIMEMLYLAGLSLKNEIVAKLLVWFLGMGICWTLYVYGSKFFNPTTGFCSAIFFYTTPLVSMVSWKTAVDLGTAFFGVLAVAAFFKGEENERWFILSGVLAGLCIGTKYVGGFVAIALLVMLIFKIKEKIRPLLLFCLCMVVFFSPWLIRNLVWKGNPIHPYLSNIFPGEKINQGKLAGLVADQAGMKLNNLKDWLISPWSLTMQGNSGDTAIGPLFLVFLPLIFLFYQNNLIRKRLGIIVLISFIFGFFISRHMRFHLAGAALLSLFLISYIAVADREMKLVKYLGGVIVGLVGFFNFIFVSSMLVTYHDPLNFFLGKTARVDYLSNMRPGYPYPAYSVVKWANENLDKNSCILFVGECRGYYTKYNFIAATAYDKNPLADCLEQSKDAGQLYLRLSQIGVTYVLFNYAEAKRLSGYGIFDWDENQDLILEEFWGKYLVPVYEKNHTFLYRLLSPEEASKPNLAVVNNTYGLIREIRKR